jgi:GH15 family glucan-1,4-alpha-glucosidase
MALRIEDYALIGDLETAALVGRDGSMDWLCWPRFDSGAVFAALLGKPEHGRWKIAPYSSQHTTHRAYRDGTLVLDTVFETAEGAVCLTDFMTLRNEGTSHLVRLVTGLRGCVALRCELVLRFDYGSVVPWVERLPDGSGIRAIAGPDMVVLRTPAPLRGENLHTVGDFTVSEGETVPFVLAYSPSHLPVPEPIDGKGALEQTEAEWRAWSARCQPAGRWSAAVLRSAITLKALTYQPTGGIVAAPTTSLPEWIGGERNWDYRYCWLRDATLTLLALLRAGYEDDARAWRNWLLRAAAGSPEQIQIMYGLGGERRLDEQELDWLPGYEGSRPVRTGNAAHGQLQLDVIGEVLDALHQAHRRGLQFSREAWALQRALVGHLEKVWQEPDQGIWETRSAPRHFTFSKVMARAAVDRAVRAVEAFDMKGPLEAWRALRNRIHADVCQHGYNRALGSFTQSYGSAVLDASLLLLPTVGFLPPEDPRILGTIAAVEQHLLSNGLVRRYTTNEFEDSLSSQEGVFLACSFWLADAYAMTGRRDEAVALFDHLLSLRNDLGLMAEEYDPAAGRMLGNFPQAFSHIALVNTAYNLSDSQCGQSRALRAGNPVDLASDAKS